MEAELMAISEAAKAELCIIRAIQKFCESMLFPVTIWCDNEAAI
jgi:hypothetical protein